MQSRSDFEPKTATKWIITADSNTVHAFNSSFASPASIPCATWGTGFEAQKEPEGRLAARLFNTCVSTSVAFSRLLMFWVYIFFFIFPNLPSSPFFSCLGIVRADTKTFICLFIVQLDHIFHWENLREAKLLFADIATAWLAPGMDRKLWASLFCLPRSDRATRQLRSSSYWVLAVGSADVGVWGISTGPCSAGCEVPGQSQETWPVPGAGGEGWRGKCVVWRATEEN